MQLPAPVEVPLSKVSLDPANFRQHYEEMDSLLASIRQFGILQPPGLWYCSLRDRYFAIWGNRRLLGAQTLGHETIWARVFDGPLDDGQAEVLQLVENLHRVDLKPSEEARGYKSLMERRNLTASNLATLLEISNAKVCKKLSLLKLVPVLLAKVDSGDLPETSGYELSKLDPAAQTVVAEKITGPVTRKEVDSELEHHRQPSVPPKRHFLKRNGFSLSLRDGMPLKDLIAELDALRRELIEAQKAGRDVGSLTKGPQPAASA